MKSLGGVMFIKDGVRFDYCFVQTIECLCELCDQVSVVGIESEDNTIEILNALSEKHNNLYITVLGVEEWEKQKGKEKLAYFQNMALSFLDTDYYFLLQADEILTEESFEYIRKAIADPRNQSYLCERVNLWGDCNHYINVPIYKQPCSVIVNRLAKIQYRSFGDGESIDALASAQYCNDIKIIHYGFVRKREVMKSKVMNMQRDVFQIAHDPKLDQSDIFNPDLWFTGKQLSPINFKHPKYIQKWVKERP